MNDKKEDEIYCPECGKAIKKKAIICPFCGIQIKGLEKKQKTWENMTSGEKINSMANIFLWGGLSLMGIAALIYFIFFL